MTPGYVEASAALPRWGAAELRPYGDGCACQNVRGDGRVKRLYRTGFGRKMASDKVRQRKIKSRSTTSRKGSRNAPVERKLTAGEWLERLVELQARLRAPDGCPWDREQTHATLRTYLVEEAYEVLDAMKSGD